MIHGALCWCLCIWSRKHLASPYIWVLSCKELLLGWDSLGWDDGLWDHSQVDRAMSGVSAVSTVALANGGLAISILVWHGSCLVSASMWPPPWSWSKALESGFSWRFKVVCKMVGLLLSAWVGVTPGFLKRLLLCHWEGCYVGRIIPVLWEKVM